MQYVKECLQLLYWIYFKPYTLKQHVREICPDITDLYFDNYYHRSAEARANPRLKRYDDQLWWLAALVPVVTVFFYGEVTATAGLHFNWLKSSLMLLGWLLGQLICRAIRRKLREKTALLVSGAVIVLTSDFLLKQLVADSLLRVVSVVASGVVCGLLGGLCSGEAFSLALGMALGVALGVGGSGVAFVVAFGAALGVGGDIAVVMGCFGMGGIIVETVVWGNVGGVVDLGVFFIFGVLRVCFWLPELLWTLCLKFIPAPPACRLRFLPPQFDQLIRLPVPFMADIIAEAYRENQAAARQTISYLISCTNQQQTAGKAMLLIAAEEFRRCRKASDIAEVRAQLDWLPAELAGQITACLELSHDTAAALEASTPFRQEERLKKVCEAIEQRRNALASASAREATTLGAVLDQWQGILAAACRTLHETALRSGELPQVYLAGPPLEPDKAGSLFKGRRDLFRQIESLLLAAQPPTLVMHGGRRSGKSSSLRYLPQQLPSDILPLFVDCQGALVSISLHGLAKGIADQIVASAKTTHRLHLPPPDKEELARDPFAALLAWLDTVEQAAPGKTFLLCLDEFERIEEIVAATGSRAPLNFLRHLIQHRDRWLLLFAGAHTPEELSPHWSDCLINTRTLRVSCLDKADAMDLLCRPVPDFPAVWPDAAAELVWPKKRLST